MHQGESGALAAGHWEATPSRDELILLATEPDPTAPEFTRVGRALQKHGYRAGGSAFPRVAGPPSRYNSIGAKIVGDILGDEQSVLDREAKQRHKVAVIVIRVIAADGRGIGYRWDPNESRFRFEGFREPADGEPQSFRMRERLRDG